MTENLRKRNVYTALSIFLLACTFLFYVTEEGMEWMMWRDTPVLAAALAAAAIVFWVLRSRAH